MSTFSECREVPLLLCCHATRRCLVMQDLLLEFLSNAPSDLGGDLPQAIWHLRDSMNLDLTAPDDGQWSCRAPCLEVFLVEKTFVRWIFIARISLLFEQIVICKQYYFKNAKIMSVLKFFENTVFNKTSEFCKMWCQLRIYSKPYRSQDTFVTVCFQTNPCFS